MTWEAPPALYCRTSVVTMIAKESKNIDAAVNLAATAKRLLSLISDGEKLVA